VGGLLRGRHTSVPPSSRCPPYVGSRGSPPPAGQQPRPGLRPSLRSERVPWVACFEGGTQACRPLRVAPHASARAARRRRRGSSPARAFGPRFARPRTPRDSTFDPNQAWSHGAAEPRRACGCPGDWRRLHITGA
jgi:hypothetical protein